jgi:hypothetical protein
VWIDLIENAYDPAGLPPPTSVLVSTFTGHADGIEAMFQEPGFSGSTGGNLYGPGDFSLTDNAVGYDDTSSTKAQWKYLDSGANRWLRLTTYGGSGWQPERNPVIAEADGPAPTSSIPGPQYVSSTVTVWMLGFPEPASLSLLAFGGLALLRRRR